MTTDILLNVSQKDFLDDDSRSQETFFAAEYGEHQIGEDENSYLDVIIPSTYALDLTKEEIHIKAPYIPVNSPIYVRFLRKTGDAYSVIQVFEEDSMPLVVFSQDGTSSYLNGCSIMGIDIDGLLKLVCNSDGPVCEAYKAGDCDLNIGVADRQAVELMMECAPGKNYRYPITGVGAAKYIGSIIDRTSAAKTILDELGDDKQTAKDVQYDMESQKLRISTDEYNNTQQIEETDTSELDMEAFE